MSILPAGFERAMKPPGAFARHGPVLFLFFLCILFIACDKEPARPPPETAEVERGSIEITVSAPGKVVPADVRTLKSRAAGEVERLLVAEGDTVKKGDLLMRLDPQVEEARLSRARAEHKAARASVKKARVRLEQAKDEFERSKELYQEGMESESEFQRKRRSLEMARSELLAAESRMTAAAQAVKEAKNRLSYTRIVSPMTGTVLDLSARPGQVVSSGTTGLDTGTPLLTIADLSRLTVKAKVEETDVASVSSGQTARIELDTYPGTSFPGRVIDIAPDAVDQGALTVVEVDIVIEDQKGTTLRPGMSATVEIITVKREDVLLVPVSAIHSRGEKKGAVVLKNGGTSWQPLRTGAGDWERVVIKEGLTAGDRVVLPP
ncbi:MAG: efflux RND transporter periplasmic adaptor subunit [bacterium]